MRALDVVTWAAGIVIGACALAACSGESTKDPAPDAGSDSGAPSGASTEGLGSTCTSTGCKPGQECVTASAPGGSTSTCEIKCSSNAECPDGFRCNLPPVVPDSLVNTCVK